jgi:hypothetical protein
MALPHMVHHDPLAGEALLKHVRAIAGEIGPRPAGGRAAEVDTINYIRKALAAAGIVHGRELPFQAPNTWGAPLLAAFALGLAGNLLPTRFGRMIGAGLSALGAYSLYQLFKAQAQPLSVFYPTAESKTLVVRIPSRGEARHKLVLVGHTDSNKHRISFNPEMKHLLPLMTTSAVAVLAVNAFSQLLGSVGLNGRLTGLLRGLSFAGLIGAAGVQITDESGGYVDGANDNASAIACLLGLGAHFAQQPLEHTEIWLAFTGAEETGCLGIHALLDAYQHELKGAWFLDFEMVGAGETVYITEHGLQKPLFTYQPDAESLALALEVARANPTLNVRGAPMTIVEEVGALRGRGYRALCLAGKSDDGWLANWHQYSDNIGNVSAAPLERAARFAAAYAEALDQR